MMIKASVFAALVSALAMASTATQSAQASSECHAVDDDRSGCPESLLPVVSSVSLPDNPPLHLPTLIAGLESLGLVGPMLIDHNPSLFRLTFSASLPYQPDPVMVDVDITTGLVVERTA